MIKSTFIIITTDFYKDEKYILSTKEHEISLPVIDLEDYRNIDKVLKDQLVNQIFEEQNLADQYVKPKFIGINNEPISKIFEDSKDYLYFTYGAICPKLLLKNNYFWKVYDNYDTSILTELGLINEVIQKTI
jgi:hypothetical protein